MLAAPQVKGRGGETNVSELKRQAVGDGSGVRLGGDPEEAGQLTQFGVHLPRGKTIPPPTLDDTDVMFWDQSLSRHRC